MAIGRDIKRGNASNTIGGKRKRSSSKKKKGFLSVTSLSVSNSNKLNKILEARRSKVSIVNSTIKVSVYYSVSSNDAFIHGF